MKILHVAETAMGGVGTYLAELLPLQAREFGAGNVRALLPAQHAAHVSGVDKQLLRRWHRKGRSPLNLLRLAAAIRAQVAEFAPDVVHAHSTFAGLVLRAMYRGHPTPFRIVYCPHGWAFDQVASSTRNDAVAAIERSLSRWCDQIVLISQHEHAEGRRIGIAEARMTVVLNGISDVPPVRPAPDGDERVKVLFVGRLDRQKGFDTLLDAAEPLGDRFTFRAIGKSVAGPAARRKGGSVVKLLGWRSLAEVAVEVAVADVVVVPSRWEGFGLVALEAMRGGCAVVASDVGGLREIVVDGVTGRLVPPDVPQRLMAALVRGDPASWRRMGAAGRRRYLDLFTADRMNEELAALYRRLVAAAGQGASDHGPAVLASEPAVDREADSRACAHA